LEIVLIKIHKWAGAVNIQRLQGERLRSGFDICVHQEIRRSVRIMQYMLHYNFGIIVTTHTPVKVTQGGQKAFHGLARSDLHENKQQYGIQQHSKKSAWAGVFIQSSISAQRCAEDEEKKWILD
jgi:hypothetical protein